jgi:hypothetical protein
VIFLGMVAILHTRRPLDTTRTNRTQKNTHFRFAGVHLKAEEIHGLTTRTANHQEPKSGGVAIMFAKLITTVCFAFLLVSSGPLNAKETELPQVTEEGLHLVPGSKLAIVYADPEADLGPYKRVQLIDTYVAFKKNWLRDQRSRSAQPLNVTTKDVERMKENMAAEFKEVFAEVLEAGGYPVVDEADDDVLLIRPAIIDLYPNAPDTQRGGRSTTYVSSAGEMTLYIELYDSVSGALLAKALDRRVDRNNSSTYTWSNSVSNKQASKRILTGWANVLLDALNDAKQ